MLFFSLLKSKFRYNEFPRLITMGCFNINTPYIYKNTLLKVEE